MTGQRAADIIASERLMIGMRWLIGVWAALQIAIDSDYYPPGVRAWAYGFLAALLIGNLVLLVAVRRTSSERGTHRVAVASMVFDLLFVMVYVWLYAFDPDRSGWALVFLIPVAGAARFQMRGALWSWAAVVVLYVAKDLWAEAVFGHEVRLSSITFRMGLALLVGALAGRLARQLHEQKEEATTALARLERVDGWRSRLVQMLAHDIRSPLGSIESTAAVLLQRGDQLEPAQAQRLLEAIRRQSVRVQHLALDLLDLARSESDALRLTPEAFDLVELLRETTPLVSADHAGVTFDGADSVPVVADRQRLAQVYSNLLGNALRHGRQPVLVEITHDDHTVALVVTDHGDGVPAGGEDTLFDAFSAGPSDGSVGLGLWMSRLLVEAHGGTLAYQRDAPLGVTRFRARLPRRIEADPSAESLALATS